jgi:hypothetical protein
MSEFKRMDGDAVARSSGRAQRSGTPHAVKARFDGRRKRLIVELDTGIEFSFEPARAHGLQDASELDLRGVMIESAGSALHFPRLDVDLSIARLLEGFLGPLDWARREARASASRENGKLGGRPRRATAEAGEPRVEAAATETPKPAPKRRIGFLQGQLKIPDDFDTMGQEEIERMFYGDE